MSVKWFIVCSSTYQDESIANLEGSNYSTSELCTTVISKLGVPREDVLYLVDQNVQQILDNLYRFLKNVKNEDTFIFYFSGHAIHTQNDLYLYTIDTRRVYIKPSSIKYSDIIDIIKNFKCNKIIAILDCCNSGAAIKMGEEQENDTAFNEVTVEGEVTLCSCAEIETSIQREINGQWKSVFTDVFTQVLAEGIPLAQEYLSISDIMLTLRDRYQQEAGRTLVIKKVQDLDQARIFRNMHYVKHLNTKKNSTINDIRNKLQKMKKWKVLLVKCSIKYPTRGVDFGVPLGLWVLKNYITLAMPNVIVDIYDERLLSIQSLEKDFSEVIADYDIVGVSMCTCEVPVAIERFKVAHESGKITVAGGIFTYSNEKYLINTNVVDYVIPGVGTLPWVKLLRALISNNYKDKELVNVKNVYSRTHMNTMVWIPDVMPGLEFHEWEKILSEYGPFLNKKIVLNGEEVEVPRIDLVTSRGCNKNCSFCSVRIETGSSVIKRDIDTIRDEIDYLYAKGVRYFSIKDEDLFIHGQDRVNNIMDYCKQYKDIRFKVRMRLDTWNHHEINIQQLKDWGIDEIQYGVESPQNDILMMLQKGIDIEKDKVVELFKEHYKNEIKVNASFILGGVELENAKYYKSLREFIQDAYNEYFFIPYINFYTPHPIHSNFVRDKYIITTNDLNFYTHKIPVAYPSGMRTPTRRRMLETYEEVAKETNSKEYNPNIPEEAKNLFIIGKSAQFKEENN